MFAVHAADLVLAAVGLESVLIATYPVSVPGTGQQKRGLYGACYPVFLSCFPVAARLGCTYGQVGSLLSFFSSAFFSTAAGVLKIMPCVSTSMGLVMRPHTCFQWSAITLRYSHAPGWRPAEINSR